VSRFRDGLLAKQGDMTGRKMAGLLSINPSEWTRIKNGKEPTWRIQRRALRLWADLWPAYMEDVQSEAC
jgi:hypothetical protein